MSICSSFLSSRTSLLPSLSVNLPFSGADARTGGKESETESADARKGSEREEAALSGSRTGSIYRLLSSDAPGITFVRFAGVDDVVAHGVGVISTREGTYLPITVPLVPSFSRSRTHTSASPRPFSSLSLSRPFLFSRGDGPSTLCVSLFIPSAYILRSFVPRYSLTVNFARIPGPPRVRSPRIRFLPLP